MFASQSEYMKALRRFEEGDLDMAWHADRMDIDRLFTWEWSHATTVEKAHAFIGKLWDSMSPVERKYVFELYVGRDTSSASEEVESDMLHERMPLAGTHEPRSLHETFGRIPATMVAGGGDADDRILKLLALADAMHDFTKGEDPIDSTLVVRAIGAELPARKRRLSPGERPEAMYANEDAVIRLFDENPALDIGNDEVPHILHGRNLLHQFKVAPAMNRNVDYWKAYREQFLQQRPSPEIVHADVWGIPREFREDSDRAKTVIYMSQIVNVVRSIKDAFGDGELTFIMDKSDDPMSRMIMATANLDEAIARVFAVYLGIDRMETVDDMYAGLSESELRLEPGQAFPRPGWHYKVCDASIVDGNRHIRLPRESVEAYPNPGLSKDPTGPVSMPDDAEQISFDGIQGDYDGPRRNWPKARVTIDGVTRVHGDDMHEFSKKYMKRMAREAIAEGRPEAVSKYFGRKRACDWGQVEHCRRHSTSDNRFVFVSADKMACLYAMYRNVDFILIRVPDKPKSHNAVNKPYFAPKILQTTFTMVRALTDDEVAAKMRPPAAKTGGGFLRFFANLALAGVVAACAFWRN